MQYLFTNKTYSNYKNQFRITQVTVKCRMTCFLWPMVCICPCRDWQSRHLLRRFNVTTVWHVSLTSVHSSPSLFRDTSYRWSRSRKDWSIGNRSVLPSTGKRLFRLLQTCKVTVSWYIALMLRYIESIHVLFWYHIVLISYCIGRLTPCFCSWGSLNIFLNSNAGSKEFSCERDQVD